MTTTREFGPGEIRLLWRTLTYDGFAAGVGVLENKQLVYLDILEWGVEVMRPEWEALEESLDQLLQLEDALRIWHEIETKYKKLIYDGKERSFNVRELPPREAEEMLMHRRHWQLHAGLSSEFVYDETGVPKRHEQLGWTKGPYMKAHYYDVKGSSLLELKELPVLGTVTFSTLWAPSDFRVGPPKDPRSDELKQYQAQWREGDPVRLDW
jgi:hypothetical protein